VREAKRPVLTIQPGGRVSVTASSEPVTVPIRVRSA